ncbi:hypothetical protein NEF87_003626 [Candidatus Lokiarchaeum ossiferum]|uniref:Transcriptional regulator n=1 Tax=Candidatus Lokiarchaeum ossiferum TaxID=2951803 RepID=A0ABY6HXP8_9ARCH|nr:hypothetical protein NEF87_003626 [Candidatus Lokiarchaeum sp. B-35]
MKAKPVSLNDLIDDETEFSILITLYTFRSLNLMQLSGLLDIPESTLLRKMKDLIRVKTIVLDNQATIEKRGKYYCLSDYIQKLIDSQDFESIKFKQENWIEAQKKIHLAANAVVGISSINHQLAKISAKFMQTMPEKTSKNIGQEAVFTSSHTILNFKSKEEIKEFKQLHENFLKQIEKFEHLENNQTHYKHTFHSFACPVGFLTSNEFIKKLGNNQRKKQK